MRVVIYGPESLGALGFIAQGFRARGHSVICREDRGAYKANYVEADKFDLAVTDGVRPPMDLMVQEYKAAGLPVLVTDLPYIRSFNGWQLGLYRLNWLPDFDCPPDRFDSLGITLQKRRRGDHIVIAGQKPGDGSHGSKSEDELAEVYRSFVAEIKRHTDRQIIFRPHPRAKDMRIGDGVVYDVPTNAQNGGLPELLKNAHALVTHCSTAGTEALIDGVPVFCDPSAQYAGVSNTDLAAIESPRFPDQDELRAHMAKVAYAQWALEEMQDGRAIQFFEEKVLL